MQHKVGVIGGGNMGAAIISSIVRKFNVSVCEKDKKRSAALKRKFKVRALALKELVVKNDIIILAVKPQGIEEVLNQISGVLTKDKLVVSIAAGVTASFIEKILGSKMRVIRTMPNMPAQIGEGITAVSKGRYATKADVDLVCDIFDNVGWTVVVKEGRIDAITAVSGSGPAYVFLFVEYLTKAAMSLGLNKKLSKDLVEETLLGSIHLLLSQKEDAASLRAKVTSKGGTTQAAADVFMKNKTEKIFVDALKAAKKRARQLSKK